MDQLQEQIKRINDKLQQLLKQYQQVQKENGQLKKLLKESEADLNPGTSNLKSWSKRWL